MPERQTPMPWLTKRPGTPRTPPGLEWEIWKRLPAVLAWGTALPLALAALLWWGWPASPSGDAADAGRLLWVYLLLGLVALHWTLVLTVAIGCWIVRVMKGPAYEADPYPPPGRK